MTAGILLVVALLEIMSTETLPIEIDGSLALAAGVLNQEWPHTIDAQAWVKKWMEHIKENPAIATDEGCMLGWFANAIMAGHDTALMRAARDANDQEIRVFLDGNMWCALRSENLQEGAACFGDTPLQALSGWLELYGPGGSALK